MWQIILGIITAIGGAVVGVGTKIWEITKELFRFLQQGFSWFLQSAPRPVLMLLFLFFVLTMGNLVMGFFLGVNYACDGNTLREYDGLVGGFRGYFEGSLEGVNGSATNLSNYVLENTYPSKVYTENDAEGLMQVSCLEGRPRLTLFGSLDFLNYYAWILIMLIGFLLSIYIKFRR